MGIFGYKVLVGHGLHYRAISIVTSFTSPVDDVWILESCCIGRKHCEEA